MVFGLFDFDCTQEVHGLLQLLHAIKDVAGKLVL